MDDKQTIANAGVRNLGSRALYLTLLLLISSATLAAVAHQQEIKIYTDDMQTLLAKGHASTSMEKGVSIYKASMYTADGQQLSQQEIRYETATLKTLYSHQLVNTPDGQYLIDLRLKDGVYTYRLSDPKGKVTVKTMPYNPDSYMDITVLRHLEQNISQLRAGQKVIITIMVPSMERSYKFDFKLDGQQTVLGKTYSRVTMKAENWLVAVMAPDISYLLDNDSNKIVGTLGPFNIGTGAKPSITLYQESSGP